MKKVYFAGAIRGGRGNVENNFRIINFLKENFIVLTEHVGNKSLNMSGEIEKTDKYIYDRDISWINECDFVVADVTTPSLGVGYEICYAEKVLNKPVLCVYQISDDKRISAMINGSVSLLVVPYKNVEEVFEAINNFDKQMQKTLK